MAPNQLEIAYMSIYALYAVIIELVEEENLGSGMVAETERKRSL